MPEAKVAEGPGLLDDFMMGEPQHESRRHVFDPDKVQIPRVMVHVKVTQPTSGRIALVIDDSAWDVHAFPTEKLSPKI